MKILDKFVLLVDNWEIPARLLGNRVLPTNLTSIDWKVNESLCTASVKNQTISVLDFNCDVALQFGKLKAALFEDVLLLIPRNESLALPVIGPESTILSMAVPSDAGDRILPAKNVQLRVYSPGLLSTAMSTLSLFVLALSTMFGAVVYGSWQKPPASAEASAEEPVFTLRIWHFLGMVSFGSLMLLLLYFSPPTGGAARVIAFCQGLYLFDLVHVCSRNILLAGVLAVLSIGLYILRVGSFDHFIYQNTLGIACTISTQEKLRIPSGYVGIFALLLYLAYDVFWVFLSPYFFGHDGVSVMETVARSDLPVYIYIPGISYQSRFFGERKLLGLGDLLIPGIFLTYCRGFDQRSKDRPAGLGSSIFYGGFLGYALGLLVCFAVVLHFQTGQPALLYLCPFSILGALGIAVRNQCVHSFLAGYNTNDMYHVLV